MALAPAQRLPLSGTRKIIASRMRQSLAQSAQLTLHRETDVTPLLEHRRAVAGPPSVTAFLARALALALREHSVFNSRLVGEEVQVFEQVNLGIAVALAGGLVAPVVRDVAGRSAVDVDRAIADVAERARAKRLTLRDFEDGTCSLTNLGPAGVDGFTPILNPPETAILGAGRTREVLVPGGTAPRPRSVLTLSLTFDHQVADGAEGAALLEAIERRLGNPVEL
jgi:pyruvate dehydrogenase E2 component (dihydrolipoamide acetyltransferase)